MEYTGAGHIITDSTVTRTLCPGGYFSVSGGYPLYYLTDWQGNNIATLNALGATVSSHRYYPYGEPWREPSREDYLFSGNERVRYDGLNDYDFHARRYNASIPRFDKQDRLNEKYPWLSPYAYCAGNPVMNTDHYGDSVAVLIAPDGAGHFGHMAILIQDENLKWRLWSKNGTNNSSKSYGTSDKTQKGEGSFDTPEDFLQSDKNPVDPETNEREYTEAYVIPATPEEDRKAEEGAMGELSKDYWVLGSNCAKTVQSALKNAGKDDGSINYQEYDNFLST